VARPQEVDVQQVMERIREAIRRRRNNEEAPQDAAASNGVLPPGLAHLQSLGELGKVTVTSHRRLFGLIVVTLKKILLKLLTPILQQQAAYNAAAVRAIADTNNRMQAMEWRHDHALAESQEQLSGEIANLIAQVQGDLDRLRGAMFARLVEEIGARHPALRQEISAAASDIKERQRIYLPYFEGASNVVDVDCEDAFADLGARDDESVGGVFSAQFIEYLGPPRIVEMVTLAYRKLAPGGWLVLETPIHPETMKFLLEATGFREVDVKPVDHAVIGRKGWASR
jgi:hypothetical protein